MFKLAFAQALLRKMHEKQAGVKTMLALGATAAGGVALTRKGLQYGKQYQAGFEPGNTPEGNH